MFVSLRWSYWEAWRNFGDQYGSMVCQAILPNLWKYLPKCHKWKCHRFLSTPLCGVLFSTKCLHLSAGNQQTSVAHHSGRRLRHFWTLWTTPRLEFNRWSWYRWRRRQRWRLGQRGLEIPDDKVTLGDRRRCFALGYEITSYARLPEGQVGGSSLAWEFVSLRHTEVLLPSLQ